MRPGDQHDEPPRASTSERLQALGLRAAVGGWVPETPQASVAARTDLPDRAPQSQEVSPTATVNRPPALTDLARGWLKDRLPPWSHHLVDRTSLGSAVTATAILVSVVMIGLLVLHHRDPSGYSPSYNSSSTGSGSGGSSYADPVATSAPTGAQDATSIVVDVGGRVHKPGLVTLPPGARVADALAAAGGPLHHRETATLDLAARVTDGQLLLIGVNDPASGAGGPAGASTTSPSSAAPVDLNSATLDELETLPGVGPVTAQKIVDWRTAHSGFTSIEQLQQVSGIGPATYAELSPLVAP